MPHTSWWWPSGSGTGTAYRRDQPAPRPSTTPHEAAGRRLGLLVRRGLDHHAHEGLGAAAADEHPAVIAELGLHRRDVSGQGGRHVHALRGNAHVVQHLGQPGHGRVGEVGERPTRPTDDVEELHRGQEPVAGGREVGEHDVTALLAAERQAALGQGLQHVAIAHGHLEHLDPVLGHPEAEAEVGHHGDHHGVLGEVAVGVAVDGADPDDLVAVDQAAGRIDREHAVGVAVEREADVGALLHHGAAEILRVGGAAAGVDVGAVRLVVEHLHGGAERAQHARERPTWRRRWRSRPPRADPPALAPRSTRAPTRPTAPPASEPSTTVPTAAPVRGRPGLVLAEEGQQLRLEGRLDLVGQLLAAGGEELHAVVGERVVRR